MADALKDASERVGGLNTGGTIAAPFFSNIGQAFRRNEFFAGLFILGFANGIFERVTSAIAQGTVWSAISTIFGVSVLIWIACWIAVSLLIRLPAAPVTRNDAIVGLTVVAAVLVPSASTSWIALTGLGLYILRCFELGSAGRRAAFVILAVTVSVFWNRFIFAMLSDLILQAEAILVNLIVGTERVGNAIRFADNSDYVYIVPACSSFPSVTLAVLVWVLTQVRRPSLTDVWWCLTACSAVIAINVTRIALIALYREHIEVLHGALGNDITGFLTLLAIVGINLIRVRDAIFT